MHPHGLAVALVRIVVDPGPREAGEMENYLLSHGVALFSI